jgi:precorrin-8X/cobalt-precorrin-8 methylmutase
MAYIREPAAIYEKSFEIARAECDFSGLEALEADVALRVVHSSGMPDVVPDLRFIAGAAEAGRDALAAGAPIFCDAEMVAAGIIRRLLPAENDVICSLADPGVAARAKQARITRSAAAVELWRPRLAGAVCVVGNAPTALYRLMELIAEGAPTPALVLGFPVGFVGAAESKTELLASGLPAIALTGRRGGSAMAAAALNAIACGLG